MAAEASGAVHASRWIRALKTANAWLWRDFRMSYDPDRAVTISVPLGALFAVATQLVAFAICTLVTPVAQSAAFQAPAVSASLSVLGGVTTCVAFRNSCRGKWGTAATLLDNGFYASAYVWAACNTSMEYGLFFCACLLIMLLMFQTANYGLSVLGAAVMVGPIPLLLWLTEPSGQVVLGLAVTGFGALVKMQSTRAGWQLDRAQLRAGDRLVVGHRGVGYRLKYRIADGGMGTVFRAESDDGRVVAVKVLSHGAGATTEQGFSFKEALLVSRIAHQGVVPVLDHGIGRDGEPSFLVMEYLVGRTLKQRVIEEGGRLPWFIVASIAERVLSVLEAAHEQGIVHRDVKPSNIYLCDDGRLKLLDFGIARVVDATLSMDLAGTPSCMAPEQVLHPESVDFRADLWSLAATMFWSVSGEWPRKLPEPCPSLVDAARIEARLARDVLAELPETIAGVIDVGLSTDPAERWSSARGMRSEILRALASLGQAPMIAEGRLSA